MGGSLPTLNRDLRTREAGKRVFQAALVLAILSGIGAVILASQFTLSHRRALKQEKGRAKAIAVEQARNIDALLTSVTPFARGVAEDLSSGTIDEKEAMARLKLALQTREELFEAGIAYVPYSKSPNRRLYAPHVARHAEAIREFKVEDSYDYTTYDWFKDGISAGAPHWGEPYFGSATKSLVVGYSVPFYRPGASTKAPIGLVRTNLSLNKIQNIVSSLSLAKTGYLFLLSRKGLYIADPNEEYMHSHLSIFDVSLKLEDEGRARLGVKAVAGKPAEEESVSGVTGQSIWIFSEPLPQAGWSLGAVFLQDEVAMAPSVIRHAMINIACCVMLSLALSSILWLWRDGITPVNLWKMVLPLSCLFVLGIGFVWWLTLHYPDRDGEIGVRIYDQEALRHFLDRMVDSSAERVRTGIFIRTMRFGTANDVSVTGQIWQSFDSPKDHPVPEFRLPDAESVETREVYRFRKDPVETVGWDFNATLRQPFLGVIKYPFDRALVRIRIAAKECCQSILLTPDLGAYRLLAPSTLPGTDKALVLRGWRLQESYFNYAPVNYGTTFGRESGLEELKMHELGFTLIAQREFLDPFISSVLPIIVVACLLFGLLILSSKEQAKVDATGFKARDVVAASAALLFPVLLAQLNLRSKIGSVTIIYIEYFYFVLYAAILGVAANMLTFILAGHGFPQYGDNLIPKLAFWPCLLGACFGITLLFLY